MAAALSERGSLALELGRVLLAAAGDHPPGGPTTAIGTVTFKCGAVGRVAYPRDALDALHRFRRAVKRRDCPGCAGGGGHAPWWRITVRSTHQTRWWWRELTVRREDGP